MSAYVFEKPLIRGTMLKRKSQFTALVDIDGEELIAHMLVVYCLKDVSLLSGSHGIPEAIAIIVVIALHLWQRKMLLSIAGGTVCYMLLVQLVF